MEVIDKKSYSLFPVTKYVVGVDARAEFSEIPITFKTHIDSPIPIPDQEIYLSSAIKYNVYDLDEIPTTQNLLFDTPEDMIAKLEEWGFDFNDFKEKICFFPYNSDENAPISNKLAKGWVKDISPNWTQWEALGIGKSFRTHAGVVELSADDQYYGDVIFTPPTNNIYTVLSLNNITVQTPQLNVFGLSNKPLNETKHIWIGPNLLKTDSTEPGAADIFSSYMAGTVPDLGAHRDGSASGGVGNLTTGYYNGISHRTPYRGDRGFSIPILFKVDDPTISGVTGINRVYGLIYFGYYEHNNAGTITNQKYFIKTNLYNNSNDGQSFYYKGSSSAATNTLSEKIDEFFENAEEWKDEDIEIPETDPYEQIQESENGGGDGTLDWTSDAIEVTPDSPVNIPGLLNLDSSGSLLNLYRVDHVLNSDEQWMRNFRDFLFDDGLLSAMEKTNADIKSCIVSLKALPYNVECTQNAYKVILGKYDTGSPWYPSAGAQVEAYKVSAQTQTLNLGSIEIKKFYGSYLDYAPHTKVQIFLPFIGVKELDVDEVMGKTLTLKYVCDNFTGLFTAHIYVDGQDLYNFNGSMAMELPISGIEYTNKLSGLLQTIGGAATTIGGVATAASGNPLGIAAAIGGIGAMAQGATGYNQGSVYKTSNLGLDWGWLGCRQPHLIISSPRLAQPRHRNGINGKATCRTVKVSDLSGYNKFADIHVDQVICSDTERALIKQALIGGFIV